MSHTSPRRTSLCAKRQYAEPMCKNPLVWNNCFLTVSVPGILENYLVTFFSPLLVIWAPHSRPAVQATDLVKDPKILVENIYKNTDCRKEFDCTTCTGLKFIPEWLLTMLPFENWRNASVFLLSGKILLHPNMHLSAGYGPQLLSRNGQEKTQTTIRQALQVQLPCWKEKVCLFMHCSCCWL